jgi:hypothetical protein
MIQSMLIGFMLEVPLSEIAENSGLDVFTGLLRQTKSPTKRRSFIFHPRLSFEHLAALLFDTATTSSEKAISWN